MMRSWILGHINECEVIGPKKFRDEIQKAVLEAYKKYWQKMIWTFKRRRKERYFKTGQN